MHGRSSDTCYLSNMITQLKHNARRQEEMFGSRWTEGGVEEAGIHEASRTNAKQAVSNTQADTNNVHMM